MRTVSGEFHENPWTVLPGWGLGVVVRSMGDLASVRKLIDEPDVLRRAVLFPDLTSRNRRALMKSVEGLGVVLSEFTKDDNEAMRVRPSTTKDKLVFWGVIVLATPFLLVNRLRGRTDKIFEMVPVAPSSPPAPNLH